MRYTDRSNLYCDLKKKSSSTASNNETSLIIQLRNEKDSCKANSLCVCISDQSDDQENDYLHSNL